MDVVVHTFTPEAEAGGRGLYEFQASLDYLSDFQASLDT